jgi:hypothetical protein
LRVCQLGRWAGQLHFAAHCRASYRLFRYSGNLRPTRENARMAIMPESNTPLPKGRMRLPPGNCELSPRTPKKGCLVHRKSKRITPASIMESTSATGNLCQRQADESDVEPINHSKYSSNCYVIRAITRLAFFYTLGDVRPYCSLSLPCGS